MITLTFVISFAVAVFTMATSTPQQRGRSAVPTVVEQILFCKQPQFKIYEVSIQTICLVGVIRDISVTSYDITYTIQDHSGVIKGIMRLETEAEVAAKSSLVDVNKYAQIFGVVRIEDGDRVLLIIRMFPVDDLNVITHHLLQYCCFTLEAEDEFNKQLASANTSAAALADAVSANEDTPTTTSATPHLTDLQKLVFDIVKSEFSDEGITKGNILRQFPSYQGHEVNQALDFLINEGIIYYSIDQQHLKAAMQA